MRLVAPAVILTILLVNISDAKAANTDLSEAEIKIAYSRAIAAHRAGQSDTAEKILRDLISIRPNVPRLRFDLAVVLAQQKRCREATRVFEVGAKLANSPVYDNARDKVMRTFCPRNEGYEFSGNFELVYDSNLNDGATDTTFSLGDISFTLRGDAVAKEVFGYRARGQVSYNFPLDGAGSVIPSFGLAVADYNLNSEDNLSAVAGLAYRHKGARADWRLGAYALTTHKRSGPVSRGAGISAGLSYPLSKQSGLYVSGGVLSVKDADNPLQDYVQKSASLRYVYSLKNSKTRLHASLGVISQDYEDDYQDLDSVLVSLGMTGSLRPRIGYSLSLAYRHNSGRKENFLFGTIREDHVTTLSGQLSFAKYESKLGRPYFGVAHTISESNWAVKDFNGTRVVFGLTKRF